MDVDVLEFVIVVIDMLDDDDVVVVVMGVMVMVFDELDVLDLLEIELVDVASGIQLGRTVEEPL